MNQRKERFPESNAEGKDREYGATEVVVHERWEERCARRSGSRGDKERRGRDTVAFFISVPKIRQKKRLNNILFQ